MKDKILKKLQELSKVKTRFAKIKLKPVKPQHRLNILFLIIGFIFILLTGRLAYMQLINKSFYDEKLEASGTYTIKESLARGQIYDATGQVLVSNTVRDVVSFTRSNTITAEEIKAIAKELAELVDLTETDVSERDKQDYYLADTEVYRDLLKSMPNEAKFDASGNYYSDTALYNNATDYVPKEAINYSEDELKVVYLFKQMNGTQIFNTVNLKTGELSDEQKALITARSSRLTGISIRSGWQRNDVTSSLASILGKVSSEETGLPAEEAEEYLALGYNLNDRVGTSYLEKQYESVLHGEHAEKVVTLDKKGKVESEEVVSEGTRGQNLQLTINSSFQSGVESILQNYFSTSGNMRYSEGIYAVALNPNDGSVLAMAGYYHDIESGEVTQNSLGTITQVFTPGSVVKGATLASGYENNVLEGNEVLYDMPITIGGMPTITSWFTGGYTPISATQALEYSSNTYMVQTAVRLMGGEYEYYIPLEDLDYNLGMERLRKTYADFGLGVATGIDLPGESTGLIPTDFAGSDVVNESFGQYDNYTTMQLAQYAATVANGGTRYATHLVSSIYEQKEDGSNGDLIKKVEPQVLNTVNIDSSEMEIIQQGFYQVANSSSAYATGSKLRAAWTISGKTGTAEAYVTLSDGSQIYTTNLNLVAYAPSYDPQIAVAVVVPHNTDLTGDVNQSIVRDIVNLYASLYSGSSAIDLSDSTGSDSSEANSDDNASETADAESTGAEAADTETANAETTEEAASAE